MVRKEQKIPWTNTFVSNLSIDIYFNATMQFIRLRLGRFCAVEQFIFGQSLPCVWLKILSWKLSETDQPVHVVACFQAKMRQQACQKWNRWWKLKMFIQNADYSVGTLNILLYFDNNKKFDQHFTLLIAAGSLLNLAILQGERGRERKKEREGEREEGREREKKREKFLSELLRECWISLEQIKSLKFEWNNWNKGVSKSWFILETSGTAVSTTFVLVSGVHNAWPSHNWWREALLPIDFFVHSQNKVLRKLLQRSVFPFSSANCRVRKWIGA